MKVVGTEVYSLESHEHRLLMRNWSKPMSPDVFVGYTGGEPGFDAASKRTLTHLYAMDGDILALCELLYCGANPDLEDTHGATPIYVAICSMVAFFIPDPDSEAVRTSVAWKTYNAVEKAKELAVRILVEQHADVNRTFENGVSYLEFACLMKNWDLITLFLEHGAEMTIPRDIIEYCFTRPEQTKFYALVESKSLSADKERPPQKCPCWSGKTIKECHATEQSYPPKFICVCGSEKIYEKCCSRKTPVVEKWDSVQRRIVHYFLGQEHLTQDYNELRRKATSDLALVAQPFIDPAYFYALKQSPCNPIPCGTKFSRKLHDEFQQQWNALIDEYIALGTDKRSTFQIERAAKIGLRCGALIRTCEGKDCSKVERKDIEALKTCAKCHVAVYCSSSCQASAWPTHKRVCCTDAQQAQPLRSQQTIANFYKMFFPTS